MATRSKQNILKLIGNAIMEMNTTWKAVLITSAVFVLPLNALSWLVSRAYIQAKLPVFSIPESMYETPVTMKEFYTLLSDYFSAIIFTVCCYAVFALLAFYLISIFFYFSHNNYKPSLTKSFQFLAKKSLKIFSHSILFILMIIVATILCKLLAAYFYIVGETLFASQIYNILYFTAQILPIIIVLLISVSFWFVNEAVIFDDCGIFDSYEYSSSLAGGKYWFRTLFTAVPVTIIIFLIAQGFSQLLTGTSLISYSLRIQAMLTKEIPSLVPQTITMFQAKDYLVAQLNQLLPLQISIAVSTLLMLLLIPQFNFLAYSDLKTRREQDPYYYDFHNAILEHAEPANSKQPDKEATV